MHGDASVRAGKSDGFYLNSCEEFHGLVLGLNPLAAPPLVPSLAVGKGPPKQANTLSYLHLPVVHHP